MARLKKAVDYISQLCLSEKESKRRLGKILQAKYNRWVKTLALKDFLDFNETIMKNKAEIGAAQFFGKFRAYAFEEYVYHLLKRKIRLKKPLKLFWGEKCLVWRKDGEGYGMEFDVSIGKKIEEFVDPIVVFEAKVELDSARLKTVIASFALLKKWKPQVKCVLVYLTRELDSNLLELAKNWINGIFHFSTYKNEIAAFLSYVAESV